VKKAQRGKSQKCGPSTLEPIFAKDPGDPVNPQRGSKTKGAL